MDILVYLDFLSLRFFGIRKISKARIVNYKSKKEKKMFYVCFVTFSTVSYFFSPL